MKLGLGEIPIPYLQKVGSHITSEKHSRPLENFFLFLWRWSKAPILDTTDTFYCTVTYAFLIGM